MSSNRLKRLRLLSLTAVLACESASAGIVKAIEYVGDHVFLTANPAEIAALDSGTITGWTRSGLELWVHDAPEPDHVPVCRFYSAAFAPRSSHFYTADAAECAAVKSLPDWVDEGVAFYARLPGAYGDCPADAMPVVRWYNGGRGGAPNHIFSPYSETGSQWWEPSTAETWRGTGWYVERVNGTAFCTHASSSDAVFDAGKARSGREELVVDSHWQLSLDEGGAAVELLRVAFGAARVQGYTPIRAERPSSVP